MDPLAASKPSVNYTYISYKELAAGPVNLRVGRVPVTVILTSSSVCTISIPPKFIMTDTDAPSERVISAHANLGTSFVLAYNGVECEVRIGRKITVTDRDVIV